jgi:hypothetical protein
MPWVEERPTQYAAAAVLRAFASDAQPNRVLTWRIPGRMRHVSLSPLVDTNKKRALRGDARFSHPARAIVYSTTRANLRTFGMNSSPSLWKVELPSNCTLSAITMMS